MIILLLLALFAHAARRRLGLDPCEPDVYILAQGAATVQRGKTFSGKFGPHESANRDDTGVGTRLLHSMPACLQEKAVPIKTTDAQLGQAVVWINQRCEHRPCVVYTQYMFVSGNFVVRP